MIAIDNVVDIFTFNPSLDLFNSCTEIQKEEILKRHTLSSIMLYTWKTSMLKIRVIDIVDQAIVDNDSNTIATVVEEMNDFHKYVLSNTANTDLFPTIVELIGSKCDKNDIACFAAQGGYKAIVLDMINKGVYKYDLIAGYAAWGGHYELVLDMMELGANDFDKIAYYAAIGGDIDIVMDLITLGARNYSEIALKATQGGHNDIVKKMFEIDDKVLNGPALRDAAYNNIDILMFMYDKGVVNDYCYIANSAAKKGRIDIVKKMLLKAEGGRHLEAFKYSRIMSNAAKHGHRNIVRYIINTYDINGNDIIVSLSHYDYFDIVKEIIGEKDVSKYYWIACNAARNGNMDLVRLCVEKGANNFNLIASSAAEGRQNNIVRFAISLGANNYGEIARKIAGFGDKEIILFLINKGKNTLNSVNVEELDFGMNTDCYRYFKVR